VDYELPGSFHILKERPIDFQTLLFYFNSLFVFARLAWVNLAFSWCVLFPEICKTAKT